MLMLLLMPSTDIPDINQYNFFPGLDKVVHIGIFFILAILLYWESSLRKDNKSTKWMTAAKVLISTIAFAFFTEEAQKYVATRSADFNDLIADCAGIGMATMAYLLLYKKNK